MALTQISTAGVKDDAVTSGKIPANAVGSSELADNAVDTAAIANNAVNSDKIATNAVNTTEIADTAVTLAKLEHGTSSNDGKFLRANNGADPSFETVTSTTINNNADNRVITGSGTANTLNGESGLTFSGSVLTNTNTSANPQIKLISAADGMSEFHFGDANDATRANILYRSGSSGDALCFNGYNNTERMRIDSSGRVLIGTTTEGNGNGDELTIAKSSGNMGMTLRSGDSSNSHIYFSDATSGAGEYAGYIAYQHSDNSMHIGTDSSERIHIKSNGSVGIGTSSPTNKLHVEDSASGVIVAKQTTNNGGFNTFEGKSSGGTTTFYASHNGRVGASDGIIFGSDTAAANALDDYEEGTWTPAFTASAGSSATTSVFSASYTKVGNQVFVICYIEVSSETGSDGGLWMVSGLPFTAKSNNHYFPISVGYWNNLEHSMTYLTGTVQPNETNILFRGVPSGTQSATTNLSYSTYSQQGVGVILSATYLVP